MMAERASPGFIDILLTNRVLHSARGFSSSTPHENHLLLQRQIFHQFRIRNVAGGLNVAKCLLSFLTCRRQLLEVMPILEVFDAIRFRRAGRFECRQGIVDIFLSLPLD
jgi:hypothetical protein